MMDSVRCEVLNASYDPLSIVSARRALNLCLKGKASVLAEHPTIVIHTASDIYPAPTQIRMNYMVKSRRTTRAAAQLTQRNMFIRDKYTCQYCQRRKRDLRNGEILTRDHVQPQSKGGKDVWTNVVTACNACNNRKADFALSQTDLVLIKEPTVPTVFEIWQKSQSRYNRAINGKD